MIDKKNVLHNSQNIYYRSTVGAAEAGSSVRLGITIKTDAVIKQVLLHTWEEGAGEKWSNLSTRDDEKSEEKFYSLVTKMEATAADTERPKAKLPSVVRSGTARIRKLM